ncbi:CDP-glucose 4,6-dehydratase [Acetanaerobacterium elongatum]|uniref:CDP-glucose 4,6-dehydratase n=1 Tax=Acetanaerobacterium elongatum TaxID=258515 RepID=A0A1H0DAF1_9FIRM|nr:CDP-glucose 4,6-dehydratase [Acetanaerobacterium elongatum]SDN66926.1 CDP-glucose 4,6-dehydratase [Acetanaerobacterium elongatum]
MATVGIDFPHLFNGAFNNRRVLITGHTGFKGSWLTLWLTLMNADVIGYALPPRTEGDNFAACRLGKDITDIRGDVRDYGHLKAVFEEYRPEVVFHLAAQPLVRLSYALPAETLDTNIMGTVNVLENVRTCESVRAAVMITSDKCYENKEQLWGYRECDSMGGYDPYSASKGCAELVCAAYARSFFSKDNIDKHICTARAGNVIGGGDWSPDRILPDCVRALQSGRPIGVRNPKAVRPWQFVLEPLYGYLTLAAGLLENPAKHIGAWNFGPDYHSVVPVGEVVNEVVRLWGSGGWEDLLENDTAPHEASLLSLDCSKARNLLGWQSRLTLNEALAQTLAWYRAETDEEKRMLCEAQIAAYCLRCMEPA